MKVLFIAPRYHTNQVPIVRELLKNNFEVEYAVHFCGATEDHSEIKPIVLKKSLALHCKILIDRLLRKNRSEEYYGLRYNASIIDLFKVIKRSKPDLVVVRGKSITERKACVVSTLLGIPSVLYNQEPFYKPRTKSCLKRFLKKIYNIFVPKIRYTPVHVSNYELLKSKDDFVVLPHTYFIPFAGEEVAEAVDRQYLSNGVLNFLMVGKFREYKTHKLLVDALSSIDEKYKYVLTFVGQCSDSAEIAYLEGLKEYVDSKGVGDKVKYVTNVKPSNMKEYYLTNDVLILPTKNEAASVSIIEAMHHGMSVISTSQNGTASYVIDGKSGYIFRTCDVESLKEKIMSYLTLPSTVETFGREALKNARSDYSGTAYFDAFFEMLQKEFPHLASKLKQEG